MMKRFLPALLASATLALTLTACNDASPDSNYAGNSSDDVATAPLPPLPPPVDTTGGKKAAAPGPNDINRELNAQNASEDIKKMQPQM